MHSSSFETEGKQQKDGGEVLVGIAALVTEGRTPGKLGTKSKGFYDGPHCTLTKQTVEHTCDFTDDLCANFESVKEKILNLWHKNIPVCVEVFLTCTCKENASAIDQDESQEGLLLEQWYITISRRRSFDTPIINVFQLINAIRSQLYFSQITAWLSTQDENSPFQITKHNLKYRLTLPGETVEGSEFTAKAAKHDFPAADIGNGFAVNVSFLSLPRLAATPDVSCSGCRRPKLVQKGVEKRATNGVSTEKGGKGGLLDDIMYTHCTLKGKHCCEESDEYDDCRRRLGNVFHKFAPKSDNYDLCRPSTSMGGRLSQNQRNMDRSDFYSANPFNFQRQLFALRSAACPNGNDNTDKHRSYSAEPKEVCPKPNRRIIILNPNRCDCCNKGVENSQGGYVTCRNNDLIRPVRDKGQLLLDAIERTARKCTNGHCTNSDKSCDDDKCVQKPKSECDSRDCDDDDDDDTSSCDKSASDIFNVKRNKSKHSIYRDDGCQDGDCDSLSSPPKKATNKKKLKDVSNVINMGGTRIDLVKKIRGNAVQKLRFDDQEGFDGEQWEGSGCARSQPRRKLSKENNGVRIEIPTASEQAKFRKNLDSAASMVFHSQTGLPLTSSPAPVRRGKSCFDFDSTINSVSAIKSALYSTSFSTDEESESESSTVSPCSPDSYVVPKRDLSPIKFRRKGHAAHLLGSFEESVLNGRLEPVSTVHGFTAELGASGSFVPKHLVCPVTVFFYTLGDNDKVSSPYLGHINLGKKGYNVPKTGTVQVTLFNPLGTVVKMFVIMYDLSDMPPNSQTFIRQRTLYMPTNCRDENLEWGPKWLRFLIHLRFMSSKSGKIYLHSDIRMIIFRKSDMDTATAHGIDMSYELRSFTRMPTNPRFSPRK